MDKLKSKVSLLPKWKTQYNAHLFPKWSEQNTMPSMTIPDQTMSIEMIIARSGRGLSNELMLRVPIYEGDTEAAALKNYMPDVMHMDPVDQAAYKALIDEQINAANARRKKMQEILAKEKAKRKEKAHQGSTSERITGEEDDDHTSDAPDNPISEKNRPPGEGNTRGNTDKNTARKSK